MKRFFTLCICLLSAAYGYAQTNTVLLMDRLGSIISTHSTIQGAYNAIPATLTQPYIIELQSAYKGTLETYPVRFVEKSGASATNTIKLTGTYNTWTEVVDTADMFEFDGADWMVFDSESIRINSNGSPNYSFVNFKNGACHNVLRRVSFRQGWPSSNTPAASIIYFSPTSLSQGNSDNTVEYCRFDSHSISVLSEGSTNVSNRNITIRNNFFDVWGHGIRLNKTTGIQIDSNFLTFGVWRKYSRAAIDIVGSGGQINITRNIIDIRQDSGAIAGIYLDVASGNQVLVANNMITTRQRFWPTFRELVPGQDEAADVTGIWLQSSGAQANASIYHNTIWLKGIYAPVFPSPAIPVRSSCFRWSDNYSPVLDVRNNLFINHRSGGRNAVHTAIELSSLLSTVKLNYNTYNAKTGVAAIISGTALGNWAQYKTAMQALNGNDANSDSMQISFSGDRVYAHLAASMYGNTGLYGAVLPDVPFDIDRNVRTNYYKGADEYIVECPSSLHPGWANISETDSCQGHYGVLIFYAAAIVKNGVTAQWQMRPAGSNLPFTDVQGEGGYEYYPLNTGPTEYRVKTGCIGSTVEVYSDTITVVTKPVPSVDSIKVEKKQGWEYIFYAMGAKLTTAYIWNFGEPGGVSSNDTVTYSFKTPGPHNIRLIVTNRYCGYDTAYATLDVGLGIDDVTTANAIKVYPNPATDRLMADVAENTAYTVTDISGRIVLKGNINAAGIDISSLSKGLYLLGLVMPDDTRVYTRFVKE